MAKAVVATAEESCKVAVAMEADVVSMTEE